MTKAWELAILVAVRVLCGLCSVGVGVCVLLLVACLVLLLVACLVLVKPVQVDSLFCDERHFLFLE